MPRRRIRIPSDWERLNKEQTPRARNARQRYQSMRTDLPKQIKTIQGSMGDFKSIFKGWGR